MPSSSTIGSTNPPRGKNRPLAPDLGRLESEILAETGPGAAWWGIERGLEAATHPLVLMLAVDLPHMTAPCLRWIGGRRREEAENGDAVGRVPTRSATGSVPIRQGRMEPLVACYPKPAHAIVSALLREQRFAARDFAKRCAQKGLVQTTEVPAQLEACFVNWNRPEDCQEP